MKKTFLAVIAAMMSILPNANVNVNSDLDRYYQMNGTITEISSERDAGTVTCTNGNSIPISYICDWEENDTVSCIIDSKGTGNDTSDDEIVSAYYISTTIEVELINRVYNEELDIMICTFSDNNGNEYTIKDTTAPYKSRCTLTLDEQGKPTKLVVESIIEDYQLQ